MPVGLTASIVSALIGGTIWLSAMWWREQANATAIGEIKEYNHNFRDEYREDLREINRKLDRILERMK